ncbi:MAG: hypothetical protein ED556_02435 [Winogradskyella sp.]|uniref:START domain-containing protein n=1 Tax=Winogradskyella sp. TaxID=1883156 RepID=UPI000F3AAB8F|nr:START domain-containing protein [Winogradskyella sp.]RNC88066.1 MAG: hypothetical protein ED556_02435 [Winogradskyella sp.]
MKKIFILIAVFSVFSNAQTDWKLKKDSNEIKIFTRSLLNESFDEYKAVTTVNVPIKKVVEELLTAPEYFDECKSGISYYLKKKSEDEHLFYARKDLPWPVKDRDIITLLTVIKINDYKYKLKLESLPDAIPEKNKTLRVKKLMGFWLLEEKDRKTKITQQLLVNPEGSLPKFVVNKLLIKGPFKTFSDLREKFSDTTELLLSK